MIHRVLLNYRTLELLLIIMQRFLNKQHLGHNLFHPIDEAYLTMETNLSANNNKLLRCLDLE